MTNGSPTNAYLAQESLDAINALLTELNASIDKINNGESVADEVRNAIAVLTNVAGHQQQILAQS